MRIYRSLTAWQRAHKLCLGTLRAVDDVRHPRAFALFDQLRRAAISVEANLVEGYALHTPVQFHRHLRIAVGSAAEVECLLNLAAELEYLPHSVVATMCVDVHDTLGLLFGLLRSSTLKS